MTVVSKLVLAVAYFVNTYYVEKCVSHTDRICFIAGKGEVFFTTAHDFPIIQKCLCIYIIFYHIIRYNMYHECALVVPVISDNISFENLQFYDVRVIAIPYAIRVGRYTKK